MTADTNEFQPPPLAPEVEVLPVVTEVTAEQCFAECDRLLGKIEKLKADLPRVEP